jgi:hypothetical protein
MDERMQFVARRLAGGAMAGHKATIYGMESCCRSRGPGIHLGHWVKVEAEQRKALGQAA